MRRGGSSLVSKLVKSMLTLNVPKDVSAEGSVRKEGLALTGAGDDKSCVEDIGEAENVDKGDPGVTFEIFEAVRSSCAVSRLTVD